jgi:hypothetical protein
MCARLSRRTSAMGSFPSVSSIRTVFPSHISADCKQSEHSWEDIQDPYSTLSPNVELPTVQGLFDRFVERVSALSILRKVKEVTVFRTGVASDLQRDKRGNWSRCSSTVNGGRDSCWLPMIRAKRDAPYCHELWHRFSPNQDS